MKRHSTILGPKGALLYARLVHNPEEGSSRRLMDRRSAAAAALSACSLAWLRQHTYDTYGRHALERLAFARRPLSASFFSRVEEQSDGIQLEEQVLLLLPL